MKRLAVCLLACLLLSGCGALPYPRELENTLLMRVLGIDQREGEVVVTAANIPEKGEEGACLTARGKDLEESCQRLKEAWEEYVALTHVTQIVVGENSDLGSVLKAVLDQREIGQTATVWRCEGTARESREKVGGGAKRLTSLELNQSGLETVTVLQALARLEETGEVALPGLVVKDGVLEVVS